MNSETDVKIVELRRRNIFWGPKRLQHELARLGIEPVPSLSGICRCLKRANLIESHARKERDRKFKRWEPGGPMELWQMDVVGGILLSDGSELKCLTGVDDHSRLCVMAAQKELDAWVVQYNTVRPHQGIGMVTPMTRFTLGLNRSLRHLVRFNHSL